MSAIKGSDEGDITKANYSLLFSDVMVAPAPLHSGRCLIFFFFFEILVYYFFASASRAIFPMLIRRGSHDSQDFLHCIIIDSD